MSFISNLYGNVTEIEALKKELAEKEAKIVSLRQHLQQICELGIVKAEREEWLDNQLRAKFHENALLSAELKERTEELTTLRKSREEISSKQAQTLDELFDLREQIGKLKDELAEATETNRKHVRMHRSIMDEIFEKTHTSCTMDLIAKVQTLEEMHPNTFVTNSHATHIYTGHVSVTENTDGTVVVKCWPKRG
ncbi:hypothetical protein [Cloacibacillus porcorum]